MLFCHTEGCLLAADKATVRNKIGNAGLGETVALIKKENQSDLSLEYPKASCLASCRPTNDAVIPPEKNIQGNQEVKSGSMVLEDDIK